VAAPVEAKDGGALMGKRAAPEIVSTSVPA